MIPVFHPSAGRSERAFPAPDLPFAAGVICGCAAGWGYNIFLLIGLLAVCLFWNRRIFLFASAGACAGLLALMIDVQIENARLHALPGRDSFLSLVCRSSDSSISFVPGLPQGRTFTAKILKINGKDISENIKILVRAEKGAALPRYGEVFSADGDFAKADTESAYGRYLQSRSLSGSFSAGKITVLSPPGGVIYHLCCIRDKLLSRTLQGITSDTVKVIISTMFFGVSGGFDNAVKEVYLKTGTLHLFSISGMHLAAVTALLLIPAMLIPFKLRYWIVAFVVGCYAVTTGANPPVMRALTVILFWCAGKSLLLNKSSSGLLALAASLLFILSPRLIYNIGAQYSFFITAMLILAGKRLEYYRKTSGIFLSSVPRNFITEKLQKLERFKWRSIFCSVVCLTAFVSGIGISAANQLPVLPGSVLMNLLLMLCVPLLFAVTGLRMLLGGAFPAGIVEFFFQLLEKLCFEGSQRIFPLGLAVHHVYETLFFSAALLFAAGSPRRIWRRCAGIAAAVIFLIWIIRPFFLPAKIVFISQDEAVPPVIAIAEPREDLGFLINASNFDMTGSAVDFLRRSGIFRTEAFLFTHAGSSAAALASAAAAVPPERFRLPDGECKKLKRLLAENGIKNVVSGGREREFVKIFKENQSCRLEYFNPGSNLSFRIEWNDTPEGRNLRINGSPVRHIAWGNKQETVYYEF
jgi:predicted membrane metal-binding protein